MTKKTPPDYLKLPDYLRLHVEESAIGLDTKVQQFAGWDDIAGFFNSSGWSAEYISADANPKTDEQENSFPIPAGSQQSLGCLKFLPTPQSTQQSETSLSATQVTQLASGLTQFIGQYHSTQKALRQREAELAAYIPVIHGRDKDQKLATRLQAVLKGGAEAVGCDSAVLLMLDEATTQLKVRAAWGMSEECFIDPPLPLKDAIADLEALLGHAVVLEHQALLQSWNVPYPCEAAVCVPVSGPMVPLGTLWMFSNRPREFTDQQVNMIEITAGRIASDLDREMLLIEAENQQSLSKQSAAAMNSWQDQLPHRVPLIDHWDVAGHTTVDEIAAASFHDWLTLDDDRLAITVGQAESYGSACKITAATLRTALRSYGQMNDSVKESAKAVVSRCAELMWSTGVGGQSGSCGYVLLDPTTNKVELALAGDLLAIHLKPNDCQSYSNFDQKLGPHESPNIEYRELQLNKKESLLLFTIPTENENKTSQTQLLDICKQLQRGSESFDSQKLLQQISTSLKATATLSIDSIVVVKPQ